VERPDALKLSRVFARGGAEHGAREVVLRRFLRRSAFVPVTKDWFLNLNRENHRVVGRAPKKVRLELHEAATDLLAHRPQDMEKSGPLWRRR
jgi:hypothetical protein